MSESKMNELRAFDVFGNIALVKFPREMKTHDKKRIACLILKNHKSIKTILEKKGKFKGRLRKQETKWLAGEKTKEALYRENGCVFRFNIDKTYFSPRLSNERKEIAEKIKKGDEVFVMFAGIAPYSIVIAKNSPAKVICSNEINREANKYARINAELNKVKNKIVFLDGDVKRVAKKLTNPRLFLSNPPPPTSRHLPYTSTINKFKLSLSAIPQPPSLQFPPPQPQPPSLRNFNNIKNNPPLKISNKFDVIVMPRPQLKESFLREAFMLSKKGTRIFYYDFCREDEISLIIDKIKKEAKSSKKKIKILNIKKAGEIAPYRYRIRIDFGVL